MVHGVATPADLSPLLARATVLAVGPGLGQGDWGRALLGRLLETGLPLVLDADALNLLAQEGARRDDWVLTPTPARRPACWAATPPRCRRIALPPPGRSRPAMAACACSRGRAR